MCMDDGLRTAWMAFTGFQLILCTILSFFGACTGLQCEDFATSAACATIKSNNLCDSIDGQINCKKTCDFCGGWTTWSEWGDCSSTNCNIVGKRIRVRRCRSMWAHGDCPGLTMDSQKCLGVGCQEESECGDGTFYCVPTSASGNCLPKSWICDGYSDCLGDYDEVDCDIAGGPDDAFFISSTSNLLSCLEFVEDERIAVSSEYPHSTNPLVNSFLWKWSHERNLRNIASGKCLTSSMASVTVEDCNMTDSSQLWNCDNGKLESLDNSSTNRFLGVDQVKLVPVMMKSYSYLWHADMNGTSFCEGRREWNHWGGWSGCLPTCKEMGKGERLRNRTCRNDVAGHGSCGGTDVDNSLCVHDMCQQKCPPGFNMNNYPWTCYKLESQGFATLSEARTRCSTIEVENTIIHARLAAIKNDEISEIFKAMMVNEVVTEMYVGITIKMNGTKLAGPTFDLDNQPLGYELSEKNGVEVLLSHLESMEKFRLKLGKEGCLDLDILNNHEAKMSLCSNNDILWVSLNDMLIHVNSKMCLSWEKFNFSEGFDTTKSHLANNTEKMYGKRCSVKDDSLKWSFDDEFIRPAGQHLCLDFINGLLTFRKTTGEEWFGYLQYSGERDLLLSRYEGGSWAMYQYHEDKCLALNKYHKVTLKPCKFLDLSLRWSSLWSSHILHRVSGKCLSVDDASPLNGSLVVVRKCSYTNQEQQWIDTECDSGYKCISPSLNASIYLLPGCGVLNNDDVEVCVRYLGNQNDHWHIETMLGSSERIKLYSSSSPNSTFCMQPVDLSCDNTKVVSKDCDGATDIVWWSWNSHGRMLTHMASAPPPLVTFNATGSTSHALPHCCLSTSKILGDENIVTRLCSEYNDSQLILTPGVRGLLSVLAMGDPRKTIRLRQSGNAPYLEVIANSNVSCRWAAVANLGKTDIDMNVAVIQSCHESGGNLDHVFHQHSVSGILCQSWNSQYPHKHNYLPEPHNYCRNPSYRSGHKNLWCLTNTQNIRLEDCKVQVCPENLGIIMSAHNGSWMITGGLEKLPYICEAPVECINGIGEDYSGTRMYSDSGKTCLNWKEFEQQVREDSVEVNTPSHRFCRNPDSDPNGIWCWVEGGIKEYCSFIQKCQIRCSAPPVPLGGRISHVRYAHSGENYPNGSKVSFECGEGHVRNFDLDDINKYDIICTNGKWVGTLPSCNILTCARPNPGVKNAELTVDKHHTKFGESLTYSCVSGLLFSNRHANISLTCIGEDIWKSDFIPYENYILGQNIWTDANMNNLICRPSCDEGYDAIAGWCVKIVSGLDGYFTQSTLPPCPHESVVAPPEFVLNSASRRYLKSNIQEKIFLAATTHSPMTSWDVNYRSLFSGNVMDGEVYLSASFRIQTKQSIPYTDIKTGQPMHSSFCLRPVALVEDAGIRLLYAEEVIVGGRTRSIRGNLTFCDPTLKPHGRYFWAPCDDSSSGKSGSCKTSAMKTNLEPCANLDAETASNLAVSTIKAGFCECAWTSDGSQPTSPCGGCSPKSNQIWCIIHDASLINFLDHALTRKYCLGFFNYPHQALVELACESAVKEKVCVTKARFSCKIPPVNIMNGYRTDSRDSGVVEPLVVRYFLYGESISYVCEKGYHFHDGATNKKATCQADGSWTISIRSLSCVPWRCVVPSNPAHGSKFQLAPNVEEVSPNTPLHVTCKTGYVVSPGITSRISFCDIDGKWHPDVAQCKPLHCGMPPYVRDTFVVGTSFSLHTQILYKCVYGMHFEDAGGKVFNQSLHTCGSNGQWFPHPHLLQCVVTICPNVKNVVSSYGTGVGQTIIIGCRRGYYLYHNMKVLPQKTISSVCDSIGRWIPSVDGLACDVPLCPELGHKDNAIFNSWVSTGIYRTATNSNYGTKVKFDCVDGFWSQEYFLIYNYASNRRVCIGVNTHGHRKSIQSFDDTFCSKNVSSTAIWRWWSVNPNHLQHASSGLCLASSLPMSEMDGLGKIDVVLRPCKTGDLRQVLHCHNQEGSPYFVSLASSTHQQTAYLKLVDKKVLVSNLNDSSSTQWSSDGGYDICSLREGSLNFQLVCSKGGEWIPPMPIMECLPSVCSVPTGRKDLQFEGTHSRDQVSYMSTITAMCADGYRNAFPTPSPYMIFRCGNLGKWEPEVRYDLCSKVFCKPLKGVQNAVVFPGTKGLSYMSEVKLSCRKGLWFKNTMLRTQIISCGRDGTWSLSEKALVCTPVLCSANYTVPQHARIILEATDDNMYGSIIILKCADGYWFGQYQKNFTIVCGGNGYWAPNDIACSRTFCNPPAKHVHFASRVTNFQRSAGVGEQATYACTNWRRVKGSTYFNVTCQSNGHWHPNPASVFCRHKRCAPLEKLAQFLPNSSFSGHDNDIGGKVKVRCNIGHFMYDGSATKVATCSARTDWFPSVTMLRCHPVNCGTPKEISSGTVEILTGTTYGSTALLTCKSGHYISFHDKNSILLKCGSGGKWLPGISKTSCQPVICFEPSITGYQRFQMTAPTKRGIGSTATLNCIDGYGFQEGSNLLLMTCNSSGLWDPHPSDAVCLLESCAHIFSANSFLSNIPQINFRISFIVGNSVLASVNQTKMANEFFKIEYACLSGFWLQPGIFKQQMACDVAVKYLRKKQCNPIACNTLPTIPFADIVQYHSGDLGGLTVNSKVLYRCRFGRYFKGLGSRLKEVTCKDGGMWNPSPSNLSCTIVKCPALSPHDRTDSKNREYGVKIRVSCDFGYELFDRKYGDPITLDCAANGMWSPAIPGGVCKPVDCGNPKAKLNSTWSIVSSTVYGGEARYNCDMGFFMKRGHTSWIVTCSGSGYWEPDDEQCVKSTLFDCDTPEHVDHTKRLLPPTYLRGKKAIYVCNSGYRMIGNQTSLTVSCGNSGKWSPDISRHVVCNLIQCSHPPGFGIATANLQQPKHVQKYYKIGTDIIFPCKPGYWRPGVSAEVISYCLADGRWHPDPATFMCILSECKALPKIVDSTFTRYVNLAKRLAAKYTCHDGLIFVTNLVQKSKDLVSVCHQKIWTPSPDGRKCEIIHCPTLPIPHSFVVGNGNFFNSSVEIYCMTGFSWSHHRDKLVTTCDASGKWTPNPSLYICQAVDCGAPLQIEGAQVAFNETKFGDEAVYSCSTGMTLRGNNGSLRTICESNGIWTPSPVNVIECINTTCDFPPSIRYAIPLHGNLNAGGRWVYQCIPGYQADKGKPNFVIFCSLSGSWIVNESCSLMECGQPPPMKYASLILYSKTILYNGKPRESAQYRCQEGRWISNGTDKSFTVHSKCEDGKWSPDPINGVHCVPVTCEAPMHVKPLYNRMSVRGFERKTFKYSSTIRYKCPKGHFFSRTRQSTVTSKCSEDGQWTENMPEEECEPVFCPSDIDDPYAVWVSMPDAKFGSTLLVTCIPTHWYSSGVQSLTMVCGKEGHWLPEDKCTPITCPQPKLIQATSKLLQGTQNRGNYSIGSTLGVSCKPGFRRSGSIDILYCEPTGEWTPHPSSVICNPLRCPQFSNNPADATYHGSNGFNSKMRFQCNRGYMITFKRTFEDAHCLSTQMWSKNLSVLQCVPTKCSLSEIKDPNIISSATSTYYGYNTPLTISCRNGWRFADGNQQIMISCGDDARWIPTISTCREISCKIPERIPNSILIVESLAVGSSALVRCDPFHWLSWPVNGNWILTQHYELNILCKDSGKWGTRPSSLQCLTTNTYLDRQGPRPGISDKTRYVPVDEYRWLSFHAPFTVMGPEYDSAMQQYSIQKSSPRFLRMNETVIPKSSNYTNQFLMTNCTIQNATGSDISVGCPNATSFYAMLKSNLSTSNLNESLMISSRQISAYGGVKQDTTLVLNQKDIANFPTLISSDISRVWDGDPLTAWKPTSTEYWKFEVNFGNPHVVKEVMIMSSSKVTVNLSFSLHDGSMPKQLYGPIILGKDNFGSQNDISLTQTLYGPLLVLSGFSPYAASIVEFSFNLPPVVREIGFKASLAEKVWVSSDAPFIAMLCVLLTIFLLFLHITRLVDIQNGKADEVTWHGDVGGPSPFMMVYKAAATPSYPMDFYIELLNDEKVNMATSTTLSSFSSLSLLVPTTFHLKITSVIDKNVNNFDKTKASWGLRDVRLLSGGREWSSTEENYVISPNSSLIISFHRKLVNESRAVRLAKIILRWHSLIFVCPTKDIRSTEFRLFGLSQRVASVFFSLSLTILVAVSFNNRYKETMAVEKTEPIDWHALTWRKIVFPATTGVLCGVVCLLLLRVFFVIGNKALLRRRKHILMNQREDFEAQLLNQNVTIPNTLTKSLNGIHSGSIFNTNTRYTYDSSETEQVTILKPSAGPAQIADKFKYSWFHLSSSFVNYAHAVLTAAGSVLLGLSCYIVFTAPVQVSSVKDVAVASCITFLCSGTMVECIVGFSILQYFGLQGETDSQIPAKLLKRDSNKSVSSLKHTDTITGRQRSRLSSKLNLPKRDVAIQIDRSLLFVQPGELTSDFKTNSTLQDVQYNDESHQKDWTKRLLDFANLLNLLNLLNIWRKAVSGEQERDFSTSQEEQQTATFLKPQNYSVVKEPRARKFKLESHHAFIHGGAGSKVNFFHQGALSKRFLDFANLLNLLNLLNMWRKAVSGGQDSSPPFPERSLRHEYLQEEHYETDESSDDISQMNVKVQLGIQPAKSSSLCTTSDVTDESTTTTNNGMANEDEAGKMKQLLDFVNVLNLLNLLNIWRKAVSGGQGTSPPFSRTSLTADYFGREHYETDESSDDISQTNAKVQLANQSMKSSSLSTTSDVTHESTTRHFQKQQHENSTFIMGLLKFAKLLNILKIWRKTVSPPVVGQERSHPLPETLRADYVQRETGELSDTVSQLTSSYTNSGATSDLSSQQGTLTKRLLDIANLLNLLNLLNIWRKAVSGGQGSSPLYSETSLRADRRSLPSTSDTSSDLSTSSMTNEAEVRISKVESHQATVSGGKTSKDISSRQGTLTNGLLKFAKLLNLFKIWRKAVSPPVVGQERSHPLPETLRADYVQRETGELSDAVSQLTSSYTNSGATSDLSSSQEKHKVNFSLQGTLTQRLLYIANLLNLLNIWRKAVSGELESVQSASSYISSDVTCKSTTRRFQKEHESGSCSTDGSEVHMKHTASMSSTTISDATSDLSIHQEKRQNTTFSEPRSNSMAKRLLNFLNILWRFRRKANSPPIAVQENSPPSSTTALRSQCVKSASLYTTSDATNESTISDLPTSHEKQKNTTFAKPQTERLFDFGNLLNLLNIWRKAVSGEQESCHASLKTSLTADNLVKEHYKTNESSDAVSQPKMQKNAKKSKVGSPLLESSSLCTTSDVTHASTTRHFQKQQHENISRVSSDRGALSSTSDAASDPSIVQKMEEHLRKLEALANGQRLSKIMPGDVTSASSETSLSADYFEREHYQTDELSDAVSQPEMQTNTGKGELESHHVKSVQVKSVSLYTTSDATSESRTTSALQTSQEKQKNTIFSKLQNNSMANEAEVRNINVDGRHATISGGEVSKANSSHQGTLTERTLDLTNLLNLLNIWRKAISGERGSSHPSSKTSLTADYFEREHYETDESSDDVSQPKMNPKNGKPGSQHVKSVHVKSVSLYTTSDPSHDSTTGLSQSEQHESGSSTSTNQIGIQYSTDRSEVPISHTPSVSSSSTDCGFHTANDSITAKKQKNVFRVKMQQIRKILRRGGAIGLPTSFVREIIKNITQHIHMPRNTEDKHQQLVQPSPEIIACRATSAVPVVQTGKDFNPADIAYKVTSLRSIHLSPSVSDIKNRLPPKFVKFDESLNLATSNMSNSSLKSEIKSVNLHLGKRQKEGSADVDGSPEFLKRKRKSRSTFSADVDDYSELTKRKRKPQSTSSSDVDDGTGSTFSTDVDDYSELPKRTKKTLSTYSADTGTSRRLYRKRTSDGSMTTVGSSDLSGIESLREAFLELKDMIKEEFQTRVDVTEV